ncbi:hypothetical protein VE25_02515 [Devosia geojensis]|uniref:Exopolysaccharide biosynthesis protein n=1 Tax=Devosia geojensis TaxID=443610 RepID=A0A0F5FWY6_9HYPH|nr:exopolysaccharide biosynthesis protein [Devosia geojensis]KKB13348.1 hypothetical protein VE25_02515 [Devosia geojensis]
MMEGDDVPARAALPDDRQEAPLETILSDVLERMRLISQGPDPRLTCYKVIDIVGPRSHILAILIFSVLNLLPGPPGYSVVIGLAIMAFSIMLFLRMPIRLWTFVGERRLPLRLLLKLLEFFSGFTRVVSKFSKPRATSLTSQRILPAIALLGFVLGVAMLVPIPFTNTLPSLGLAIVCVGILNRDGIAVLIGGIVGLIGLVVLAVTLWAVFAVGVFLGEAIQHEIPDTD